MKVGEDYKLDENASLKDVIITYNLLFDKLGRLFNAINERLELDIACDEKIWDAIHVLLVDTEDEDLCRCKDCSARGIC